MSTPLQPDLIEKVRQVAIAGLPQRIARQWLFLSFGQAGNIAQRYGFTFRPNAGGRPRQRYPVRPYRPNNHRYYDTRDKPRIDPFGVVV